MTSARILSTVLAQGHEDNGVPTFWLLLYPFKHQHSTVLCGASEIQGSRKPASSRSTSKTSTRQPFKQKSKSGLKKLTWTPKVCRIIAFYGCWATSLPTFGGLGIQIRVPDVPFQHPGHTLETLNKTTAQSLNLQPKNSTFRS